MTMVEGLAVADGLSHGFWLKSSVIVMIFTNNSQNYFNHQNLS
jgi:hypothetical protein